jgi:S-adenosylmethionine-diacylglycerol 3-amino-3-carboxypropyl transferase
MPVPELESLVERVARALAPGGVLLLRRLNGDHDLAAIVARRLEVDRAESERLRDGDRSFFYREVVAGRRRA